MSREALHNTKDNYTATLDGAVSDSVLSWVVDGSGAGSEPTAPFYATADSETVEVTAVATSTPNAGHSTWTVVRGQLGTSAASHLDNASVKHFANANHLTEMQTRLTALEGLVIDLLGGTSAEGVQRTGVGENLLVEAQGTPGMTVKINIGSGIVSEQPAWISAAENTATMTAPSANPRIDIIQINRASTVSIKTGSEAGSPTAPTVASNNLKLAEIYHRVGTTSIKDTDDSTNSYITDSRVFF